MKFFKNYFVTGDYVVAGVGLQDLGINGIATGVINVSGVPANAEALAALLYWQVVSSNGSDAGAAGATFNGQLLTSPSGLATPDGPIAVVGDPFGTSPCWSSGGGTGQSGGSKKTYTYRADVLRFLPVGPDGRHQINGAHTVALPDLGNSNATPRALGASLVVIYRHPTQTDLNAIVIYDGSHTMDNVTQGMTQVIKGFYDPAPASGKLTHIVGSGQANKTERLLVPGGEHVNSFQGLAGASWDNVTVATGSLSGASSFTTSVDSGGSASFDCLTWGAVVYRTRVNDGDGDGNLDRWEQPGVSSMVDPRGDPLPNLYEMGARDNQRDVMVEIGYMGTTGEVPYGGVSKPEHTHAPTHAALKKVGDAFALNGIRVWFDLGDSYPSGDADPYIIHGPSARGGEVINELDTVCPPDADQPWVCQFSAYPGTVGWKSGFRYFRDKPLTLSDDACDAAERDDNPATTCERVFDRNRKDAFRYVLFAHAVGVPKEDCLIDDPASPDFGFPDVDCQNGNALFHVPVTSTGVGDFPGGDAMVALGAFDDVSGKPVGTDYMQAATLMHELGHTFQLRHGGALEEPNCKPNYLSVMNYLFQLRGLRDISGVAQVNFSGQTLGGLDESNLPSGLGLALDPPGSAPPYRTGWYAPEGIGTFGTAASKHCDGTPLSPEEEAARVSGNGMVRVDTLNVESVTFGIDWNPSSALLDPQDINFDGATEALNPGFNDWAMMRLNQVGSRRNVGGWYWVFDPAAAGSYVAFMGPLSLDVGRGDLGRGDLGRGDLGGGDLGRGDLGRGDLGRGDLGRGDLGRGDLGRGDLGRGDLGRGDLGRGDLGRGDLGDSADGEVTSELAAASGFGGPNELTARVVGTAPAPPGQPTDCSTLSSADCHRIRLDWKPPNAGTVTVYKVSRVGGATGSTPQPVGQVAAVLGQVDYFLVDGTELPNGDFTYVVTSEFAGAPPTSSASLVTVTAVNSAPVAADNGPYATDAGTPLVVAAPGVLGNDTDVDSPTLTGPPITAALVTGPLHGTLVLNANGSFTYTPAAGYFGPDSFTYTANDVDPSRSSNVATVSINVNAVQYTFFAVQNIPPAKSFKAGSALPMKWQYKSGSAVVDSALVHHMVTVRGPLPNGPIRTITDTDPGSSSFRYDPGTRTWNFNLQTKEQSGANYPVGTYDVQIIGSPSNYQPSPVFQIKLVK